MAIGAATAVAWEVVTVDISKVVATPVVVKATVAAETVAVAIL